MRNVARAIFGSSVTCATSVGLIVIFFSANIPSFHKRPCDILGPSGDRLQYNSSIPKLKMKIAKNATFWYFCDSWPILARSCLGHTTLDTSYLTWNTLRTNSPFPWAWQPRPENINVAQVLKLSLRNQKNFRGYDLKVQTQISRSVIRRYSKKTLKNFDNERSEHEHFLIFACH